MIEIRTFIGFEELTGKRFRLESLPGDISAFSVADLLTVAARLNYFVSYPLLLPAHRGFNPEPFLVDSLLGDVLRGRLSVAVRDWPGKRRIFNRQQGLTLLNLALLHARPGPGIPTGSSEGRAALGQILLKINETLFSKAQLRQALSDDTQEKRMALQQQLGFLLGLYNPGELSLGMFRGSVMLDEEFPKRSARSLKDLFRRARSLELDVYRDILLCLAIYYLTAEPAEVVVRTGRLIVEPDEFCKRNQIPAASLRNVLEAESASISELQNGFRVGLRGRVEQDFSLWRRLPFVRLGDNSYQCVDPLLLVEKFGTGLRWTLVNALEASAEREIALGAFGELHEGYCDWLLRRLGDTHLGGEFYSFPAFVGRGGDEAADGLIVSGSHAVLLEYRLGTMPTAATSGDDTMKLLGQVSKIFGDDGGAKLAKRLETLFAPEAKDRRSIQGVDLDRINRVTPIFVVHDGFWRFPLAARSAAESFTRAVRTRLLRSDLVVESGVIIDIELLESLMGCLVTGRITFCELLWRYREERRDPMPSFREFLTTGRARVTLSWWKEIEVRLENVWNSLGQRYFGADVWQSSS